MCLIEVNRSQFDVKHAHHKKLHGSGSYIKGKRHCIHLGNIKMHVKVSHTFTTTIARRPLSPGTYHAVCIATQTTAILPYDTSLVAVTPQLSGRSMALVRWHCSVLPARPLLLHDFSPAGPLPELTVSWTAVCVTGFFLMFVVTSPATLLRCHNPPHPHMHPVPTRCWAFAPLWPRWQNTWKKHSQMQNTFFLQIDLRLQSCWCWISGTMYYINTRAGVMYQPIQWQYCLNQLHFSHKKSLLT